MTSQTNDPEPLPLLAIVLLWIAVAILTALLVIGIFAAAVFGGVSGSGILAEIGLPDTAIEQVFWVQKIVALFSAGAIWAFGLIIVINHATGAHARAAGAALWLIWISIGLLLANFAVGFVTPIVLSGSAVAALVSGATGAPLVLAQIALLLCAGRWLSRQRRAKFG